MATTDAAEKYIPENRGAAAKWIDNIYQLERTDPVLGGAYGGAGSKLGIMNRQPIELAERTQYLKNITDDTQQAAYPKTRLSEKISAEDVYTRNIIRLLGNYGFAVPKSYTDYTGILKDYLGYTYRGQTNDILPYFSAGVSDTYCVAVNPSPSPEEQELAQFVSEEDKNLHTKIIYWAAKAGEDGRDQPIGIAIKGGQQASDLVITKGFVRLNLQNHINLQQYADSGLPKGETVYLSDQYAGQLTLNITTVAVGMCIGGNTIYLDPVGSSASGGGEVTYEDQDYASLLESSSFSEMYYDTFQEFSVPEDAPINFPTYNYAETCLEGDLGLDGVTPTQYTVNILDSMDLGDDAAVYYSFGTVVYVSSPNNIMKLEYTTDKLDNPNKTWHKVENLFGSTVEQEEGKYNVPASQGYPLDCYITAKPFTDLSIRFTWTGVNKLLSFAVLYGEIPVVSNTTPTMYVEYEFENDWDGTTDRTIMIPRLSEFQATLPDELADQEEYGGSAYNTRPYAYKKDGKTLGVRDSLGRYLVCGVHYSELNGGIKLLGNPVNPKFSYNVGDKIIFFGYGGLADASTENTARLDNITDDDNNIVLQGRDSAGNATPNRYRLYVLEDAVDGNKLVYEKIVD